MSSRARAVVAIGVLVVTVVLGGCGTNRDGGDGSGGTVADARFDFTADTVGGGTVDTGELAGEPFALWFWSPW